MKFGKTILVGGKAIIGSVLASLVMWVVLVIGAFIGGVGGISALGTRPTLMWALLLIGLLLNVYVLGLVYNKLWGWK